jgi:hypothetical protein
MQLTIIKNTKKQDGRCKLRNLVSSDGVNDLADLLDKRDVTQTIGYFCYKQEG